MVLPPVPITPPNHPLSIDNKLSAVLLALAALGGSPGAFDWDEMTPTFDVFDQLVVAEYKLLGAVVKTATMTYVAGVLTHMVWT